MNGWLKKLDPGGIRRAEQGTGATFLEAFPLINVCLQIISRIQSVTLEWNVAVQSIYRYLGTKNSSGLFWNVLVFYYSFKPKFIMEYFKIYAHCSFFHWLLINLMTMHIITFQLGTFDFEGQEVS